MTLRPSPYQWVVIAVAAAIGLSMVGWAVARGVPAYEVSPIATSVALVLAPFAVLGSARRPRWPVGWAAALVALVAGTGWGMSVAASDAQGGLVFLWLLPLEAGVAALGAVPRREAEPTAPPAGWYPDPGARGRWRWWDGARWTERTAGSDWPARV